MHAPGNKHVDDGINDEHQEDIAQTEVIIQRYVVIEIVPLSSLTSDLQQRHSIDTHTRTCVREDTEGKLFTTVKAEGSNIIQLCLHMYTLSFLIFLNLL